MLLWLHNKLLLSTTKYILYFIEETKPLSLLYLKVGRML